MTKKIVLVCHAGPGIGLGHLRRSLVIAKSIETECIADVEILIVGEPFVNESLKESSCRFLPVGSPWQIVLAELHGASLVIFDLHRTSVGEDFHLLLDCLKKASAKVIAVDCLFEYLNELDLIFHPSFLRPAIDGVFDARDRDVDLSSDGVGRIKVLHGWDCFLLDERLVKREWYPGSKVLILTGGSDATFLGRSWPKFLADNLPLSTTVDWVVGPFSELPSIPESNRVNFVVHKSPNGLSDLITEANYAITVYGVSFFELLFCGVPTVTFSPYGVKDSAELHEISAKGVALVAPNERSATLRLIELMASRELAQSFALNSSQMVSDRGQRRLITHIKSMILN
jgi:spore coat polysaccharide biosynthesis predicted glycosyltransferase SpsG